MTQFMEQAISPPQPSGPRNPEGYAIIPASRTDWASFTEDSLISDVMNYHQGVDRASDNRKRSHQRVTYQRKSGLISPLPYQGYSQSADYNPDAAGAVRHFSSIDPRFLTSKTLANALKQHLQFADQTIEGLDNLEEVSMGLHLVRYLAQNTEVATSSPPWLHVDQERAVTVFVLGKSANLEGGQNVWVGKDQKYKVIDLDPMDGIFLTQNGRHAVMPMWSKNGRYAYRDILIITTD